MAQRRFSGKASDQKLRQNHRRQQPHKTLRPQPRSRPRQDERAPQRRRRKPLRTIEDSERRDKEKTGYPHESHRNPYRPKTSLQKRNRHANRNRSHSAQTKPETRIPRSRHWTRPSSSSSQNRSTRNLGKFQTHRLRIRRGTARVLQRS